jgi:AcrR family transcriptional regulator
LNNVKKGIKMTTKTSGHRPGSLRVRQKREQVRLDILQAAQEILGEQGVDDLTLAAVAGRLGMTKQALYHYFPSKEALVNSLVTTLLDEEVEVLVAAVERAAAGDNILGTLIRAFYAHYIDRLDAFRTIYCQSQLYSAPGLPLDTGTLRDQINPRTRHLFDVLEDRIAGASVSKVKRARARQLAFTAWLSALGLLTMLGVADATRDPLVHADTDLLETLSTVFGAATDR